MTFGTVAPLSPNRFYWCSLRLHDNDGKLIDEINGGMPESKHKTLNLAEND